MFIDTLFAKELSGEAFMAVHEDGLRTLETWPLANEEFSGIAT